MPTPDADTAQEYRPGTPPSLPGTEMLYVNNEDRKVSRSISTIISVLKLLEDRLVALGG